MQKDSSHTKTPHIQPNQPMIAGQNKDLSVDLQAESRLVAMKGTIACVGPTLLISEQISRNVKLQYVITPQLLLGTPVSELKRAVLRSWICEESAKLRLDRLIVATATQLVDMFLSRGGVIQLEDFQALGIAALLLSNKAIANEVTIRIDYRMFPLSLINQLELRLCKTCNFRLNPITYVHILDELVSLWNNFADRHSDLWKYGCRSEMLCQNAKIFTCRQLYEFMDTIFLVVETFNHSTVDLCLHAFRYFLVKDYQVIRSLPKSIEDQVIIKFWVNPQDQPLMNTSFPSIFTHFLQFIDTNCHTTSNLASTFDHNSIVQDYLQLFLSNGFEKLINRALSSQIQTYKQTFNPLSLKISKSFFSLKKNQRKGSGETMSI